MGEGRVLGIDFGLRRIGVALSDPLRMVATPLETVDGNSLKAATRRIRELVAEKEVSGIVVGLPLLLNGDKSDLAEASEAFARKLQTQLPSLEILLWDERLSSTEAERAMRAGELKAGRRKQLRDQLAAQLILQSWLDAQAGQQLPMP